ncbi:YgaP family membrane protein [Brevibacillus massiliensis]|jgi:hypothetical protein|uniref:YgaP family membrane protein n=1 Tax=Brevibacillus massiliensis TaxID=1118054 RepID=UPI0002EBD06A|nr:DUF2892 domain-containing protein [Brevibacillus massiliensis]
MQKNVGTLDAYLRIMFGILGLAYGVGRMARRPHRTPWILMMLSAMKVAEGVTRYCPMLKAMGINTRQPRQMQLGSILSRITPGKGEEKTDSSGSHKAERQYERTESRHRESDHQEHAPSARRSSEDYRQSEHLHPMYP